MANLKQIRKHIASVQSTGKITKAMKMVAVSKLRKSQAAVVATRPYVNELINVIEHLVSKEVDAQHPLLRNSENKKSAALIIISGGKGLCGAYNHNIVKSAKRFIAERGSQYESLKLYFIGKKAYEAMRNTKGAELIRVENGLERKPSEVALEISKDLCEQFSENKLDEAFVLYTKFRSAISQNVILDAILPLQAILKNIDENGQATFTEEEQSLLSQTSYIYEPSEQLMLDVLLPRAVAIHIQRSILESLASEHGARMTAMDSASKNAVEMINSLTIQFNRARQAAITNELIEVISGAESL